MLRATITSLTPPRITHSFPIGKYDFDAWAYNITWPQSREALPLLGRCSVVVEDIKFAINAWMLLRLCMFYGVQHPSVLSHLRTTQPTMDIKERGNRLFYMHSHLGASVGLGPRHEPQLTVALTPSHPAAVSLHEFDWSSAAKERDGGIALVLGMENGLSEAVVNACDEHIYIPQYGSIGSLSMLSALAIATHHAHSYLHPRAATADMKGMRRRAPTLAHQPETSTWAPPRTCRPHEASLLPKSNDCIREYLRQKRSDFPLQLWVLSRNEIADRSIGATIRNANVYNCDGVILYNRRKFNMRGTVGTHHYTPTLFYETKEALDSSGALSDMEVWLLHASTYPYLQNHFAATDTRKPVVGKKGTSWREFQTFIRPENPDLQRWVGHQDVLLPHVDGTLHPMVDGLTRPVWAEHEPIFLDDEASVVRAVCGAIHSGKRGIALVLPEEGSTPHPELVSLAHRLVYVVHPMRLALHVQRGLTPALASAVALERIRFAMNAAMDSETISPARSSTR